MEDVLAQLEDAVHAGQLLEHDGVRDLAEEAPHELADDQHDGHPARKPRLGGLTLSLKMTMGSRLQWAWQSCSSMTHHSRKPAVPVPTRSLRSWMRTPR